MSQQEITTLVNNELTERVNKAYVGKDCMLLDGSDGAWIMIKGEKNEQSVDILVTLVNLEETVVDLRKEVNEREAQSSKQTIITNE